MFKIHPRLFSGTSKVFDGSLETAMRGLAQFQVQTVLVAAAIASLTDSSGGVAANGLVVPAQATPFDAGASNAVAKAEVETTLGVVRQSVRSLITQTNLLVAAVPAFATLTDNIGGSAPATTLAAIDDSMTGTSEGGTLATAAGFNTVVGTLNERMVQLARFVNLMAEAAGVTKLTLDDAPVVTSSTTFAAVATDTGSTTNLGAVSKAQGDAILDTLADNIATLAAKLDEIGSVEPTLAVIAA